MKSWWFQTLRSVRSSVLWFDLSSEECPLPPWAWAARPGIPSCTSRCVTAAGFPLWLTQNELFLHLFLMSSALNIRNSFLLAQTMRKKCESVVWFVACGAAARRASCYFRTWNVCEWIFWMCHAAHAFSPAAGRQQRLFDVDSSRDASGAAEGRVGPPAHRLTDALGCRETPSKLPQLPVCWTAATTLWVLTSSVVNGIKHHRCVFVSDSQLQSERLKEGGIK